MTPGRNKPPPVEHSPQICVFIDTYPGAAPPGKFEDESELQMMNFTRFSKAAATRALLIAVCAVAALPAIAQESTTPPPPPPGQGRGGPGGPGGQERMVEMLTRRLSLTPDQVTQVKAIQAENHKQAMAMRDDNTAGADRHAKMEAMRQAEQAKVREILTDEQKTKYDAMLQQMKERRGRGPGGPGGPEGPGGPDGANTPPPPTPPSN